MIDNYKYKLQYFSGDKTVTHEFNADITSDKITDNLRDFLCACSWKEDIVENEILNLGETFNGRMG